MYADGHEHGVTLRDELEGLEVMSKSTFDSVKWKCVQLYTLRNMTQVSFENC